MFIEKLNKDLNKEWIYSSLALLHSLPTEQGSFIVNIPEPYSRSLFNIMLH